MTHLYPIGITQTPVFPFVAGFGYVALETPGSITGAGDTMTTVLRDTNCKRSVSCKTWWENAIILCVQSHANGYTSASQNNPVARVFVEQPFWAIYHEKYILFPYSSCTLFQQTMMQSQLRWHKTGGTRNRPKLFPRMLPEDKQILRNAQ